MEENSFQIKAPVTRMRFRLKTLPPVHCVHTETMKMIKSKRKHLNTQSKVE